MPLTGMYVLQGVVPAEVAVAPFDVKVIDIYNDSGRAFTAAEVAAMGGGPGGGLLLGYFSIGEAEVYRDYFASIPKSAIGPENPDWKGNFEVAYWTPEWRAVATAYIDRVLAAGYDGIYFDVVDEYQQAWAQRNAPGGNAEGAMVDLVRYLADYARARNPDFKVWANNAEELLDNAAYLATIDGMFKENLFYQDNGSLQPSSETKYSLSKLNIALAAGKDVIAIEYVSGATKIADVQAKAAAAGVGSYIARLDLDGINYAGVLPGQTIQDQVVAGVLRTGDGAANLLTGGGGADTLVGAGGNDTLDGGAGADSLVGGTGNDVYIVDSPGDIVVETSGQGTDTVITSLATYALPGNVEHLIATGTIAHTLTGNTLANRITGNAGADTLHGAGGNDTLDGGAGADRLVGGAGNDYYIVGSGDVVIEGLNQGMDTVLSTEATTYQLGANLEVLVLGEGAPRNGTGNGLANLIMGNAGANLLQGLTGADTLMGGDGIDTLVGGADQDVLVGGAGSDIFRFDAPSDSSVAAPDRILDFTYAGAQFDRISLVTIDANANVTGNQAFTYIGAAGFTGVAGQLRVEAAGAGTWLALGDVNGDAQADFALSIVSATAPVAGWFML